MEKSFQELMQEIISRKYTKNVQHNSRVILKKYYSQNSTQRRSLTLQELGKLPGLDKELTRERSRQVLEKFRSEILKREIELLERGEKIDDSIMLSNRKDLASLRIIVQTIVDEIESFPKPVFAWRLQDRLLRNKLIEKDIYLPIVAELAESFSIDVNFDIEEYKGHRIIIGKGQKLKEFTSDIISYAGKSATHLGGACSFEAITGNQWDEKRPDSIGKLSSEIQIKYIKDVLGLNNNLMLLNNETYFAFKDRDERLSHTLSDIFSVYHSPINKEILMNALVESLTHCFKTETKSELRDHKIHLVESAKEAFDEFCRRTLLLDEGSNNTRKPGSALKALLKSNQLTGTAQSQAQLVEAIKKRGGPVGSMEFGKIFRNELGLPEAHKASCYSYPVLYYKEGEKRMNSFYKTLDGVYSISVGGVNDISTAIDKSELEKLKEKILQLQSSLKEFDDEEIPTGKMRKEQGLLRQYLIGISDGIEMSNGEKSCKCQICNRYFSAELLVAAHIKKRAKCTHEEKADIENIAMLQCGGCDKLFENGYLYIDDTGSMIANHNAPLTDDVIKKIARLEGNKTEYFNQNKSRQEYITFHREYSIKTHSGLNK